MSEPVSPLPLASVRGRASLRLELVLVTSLALALLLPGVWRYSLVDPWESHYGEVARRMLQDHDWVRTQWQNEGFRSKPVLTFWMMAASMRVVGVGDEVPGGYSGEMADSPKVMLAIRLPMVLLGAFGLVMMWWMLRRLVSRRAAWLAFLTVGTTPFYFFIARQGITDMTLVGLLMGAFAVFLLSAEDGEHPIAPLGYLPVGRRRWLTWDARWVFVALVGGFVLGQAVYYFFHFQINRFPVTRNVKLPQPGIWLLATMTAGFAYVAWPRVYTWLKALLIWPWVTALAPTPRPWARSVELGAHSALAWPLAVLMMPWVALLGSGPVVATSLARARRVTALEPLTRTGQIYMLWFWALVSISVLGKGLPGFGLAGVCCAAFVVFQNRWGDLARGRFEIKRGIVLVLIIVLPWHLAMWMRDGPKFIQEWVFTHNLNRAAVGVHGDRGTFDYCLSQVGQGMFLWAGLVPLALAAAVQAPLRAGPAARVRFMIGVWAVAATALFSLSQTKFHHYIFPAVPALSILVALWLDDYLAKRIKPSLVLGALGAVVVLLVARDMMHEEKQWIEMFIYRYDRPWPSTAPWSIDASDAFLVMGLGGALAVLLVGTRLRRLAVAALAAAALGSALWAMHVYMPIAGQHWGMRDAVRRYYQDRQLYGQKLVYYTPRNFADEWAGHRDHADIYTFIPDRFSDGQPMQVSIEVQGLSGTNQFVVPGTGRVVGDHHIRIDFSPAAAGVLRDIQVAAQRSKKGRRGRRTTRVVDADRLIAWQLYWRGENFWSGDEIWGVLPEMQTALKETDNVRFLRYLNDRGLAPEGRRYFVVTEAGRAMGLRSLLPTDTGKATFEVLDTTSNKFSLAVFQM